MADSSQRCSEFGTDNVSCKRQAIPGRRGWLWRRAAVGVCRIDSGDFTARRAEFRDLGFRTALKGR